MIGNIQTNIRKCEGLFKAARLVYYKNDNNNYDVGTASEFAGSTYVEEWFALLQGQRFDFRLDDLSLIQFRSLGVGAGVELRYAFYEAPVLAVGYRAFLKDFLATNFNEIGYGAWAEYEEYVLTAPAKAATPLRYDHAPGMYTEGVHPASHLHVGYRSQIRLCTGKCWQPMTFALFILRQTYPDLWKAFLCHSQARVMTRYIRDSLLEIPCQFSKGTDAWQAVLR